MLRPSAAQCRTRLALRIAAVGRPSALRLVRAFVWGCRPRKEVTMQRSFHGRGRAKSLVYLVLWLYPGRVTLITSLAEQRLTV
jgi:hypothetical protein